VTNLNQALADLKSLLAGMGPVAVAVSGGVDSMTLAFIAHQANQQTQQFHAISPAVPVAATDRVKRYADHYGWTLHLIDAGEISDPDYQSNPANRCYYCKTNLYDTVVSKTSLPVISGTNLDDLGDYRPGLIAAEEHQVKHPYVEAGITKPMLRQIAKNLGLSDLHDLPAAPCLSSRVTTGIPIDPILLPVIDQAEQLMWSILSPHEPIKGVRCRIRPGYVGLEVESEAPIDTATNHMGALQQAVAELFEDAGLGSYSNKVTIEPYQRGSAFLIDAVTVD